MKGLIVDKEVKVTSAAEFFYNGEKSLRLHIEGESLTEIDTLVKADNFSGVTLTTDKGEVVEFAESYTELESIQRFISDTADEIQLELKAKEE